MAVDIDKARKSLNTMKEAFGVLQGSPLIPESEKKMATMIISGVVANLKPTLEAILDHIESMEREREFKHGTTSDQ